MPLVSVVIPRFQPRKSKFESARALILFVVVLAIFHVWTTPASASCGSYLYRNGKPVSDANASASSQDAVHLNEMESEQIPAQPCRGPNCSRSPVPLMPVPAAPTTVAQGFEYAAILGALSQVPSPFRGVAIPESERGAHFVPSSIFRPPAV